MNPISVKEIPCLTLDKIISIFRPDDSDTYVPGLLIGERRSRGESLTDMAFVHPFSVNAFIFVFCEEGEVVISTNSEEFVLHKHTLYINFPGQIMRTSRVSNCRVKIAVLDLEFIREKNLDIKPIAQKLLALKFSQCMNLEAATFSEMEVIVEALSAEVKNNEEDDFSVDVLRSLITALFFKIGRVIGKMESESDRLDQEAFNKNAGYFKEFMIILGQNFKRERSVGFYADQMHLSPKYFTTLIKRTSGQTAAEWINHYVILEAKNLLKYSTMNVQEIAYSLNFPNQSFFGKYFKHHTGMTPSEYKKL